MFENLTDRLTKTLKYITGKNRLTQENIKSTISEVRVALLEADVALPVIQDFIKNLQQKAIGIEVSKSLTPSQEFIKIVQAELEMIMGNSNETLNLLAQPPVTILVAGLQGSGKTTSVAKLSRLLLEKHKKKVLVVSTDIYRPAAIKQLEELTFNISVDFYPSFNNQNPIDIANSALLHAKKNFYDALLIDTAGRLAIDAQMMDEIKSLHNVTKPTEMLFVVDSMTGQDAANIAKEFNNQLPLTGIILTKVDGDARGGAALSIRSITGKPIKFFGIGEKTHDLEAFHPKRIASRILGMGDVLSLIEEIQQKVSNEHTKKLAKKLKKQKGLNLEDFREQLKQMSNIGGIKNIIDKLPQLSHLSSNIENQIDNDMFKQMEFIINSMTIKERRYPEIIKSSRKKRIAAGSGTKVQDVNYLLRYFNQTKKMMQKMRTNGMMQNIMRGNFNL
ncbi:signal recognition particle GTPase [Candidatus Photodesmus katoptron]|uniref:Signal recognition particle protein n=1 Tax=Candidatus Photodesmus katoptron Akat1 TaxID=1236703 RepID=S3DHE7_9GAMM|nr:signal recognition particle protein [Candidatus Photodesmus katoptron]EPE37847.1 SRP54-type protein, GTPase protein [Candidatus Photodesmus katoptron Akat1]KEY90434.1 signal recognition particle GTPase [Candidatus Photodesmus katoptron]